MSKSWHIELLCQRVDCMYVYGVRVSVVVCVVTFNAIKRTQNTAV